MTPPEKLYETEYEVGQDNIQKFGMDIHNPVFWIAAVLIMVFVIGTLLVPESAKGVFDASKAFSINNFDWLFLIAGNIFVVFCIVLVFMPVGSVRLGGQDATPEFSLMSWFAMLFAAGMGIGLMFWSVAEPVGYYTDWFGTPLGAEPNTPEGAKAAMGATMYHWGLHPWAIYAVVGLSLAFFCYNKGLPLTIRSAFYPLVQDKSWGWFGNVIDVVAVLATIFGLATSLGFGAQQAAGGLEFLFGIPATINTQIAIIVGVTGVAVISVVRGLDGGVKVLSNINMTAGRSAAGVRDRHRLDHDHPDRLLGHHGRLCRGHAADERVVRPRGWLVHARLDGVLLGLVDFLVAVRRHVHRPRLARPHGASVHHRRAAGADRGHHRLDDRLRGHRPATGHHRHRRAGRWHRRLQPVHVPDAG